MTVSHLRRISPLLALPLVLSLAGCPRPAGVTIRKDDGTSEVIQPKDPFADRTATVEVRRDAQADAALAQAAEKARTLAGVKAADVYLSVRKAYPETTAGQDALYRAGVAFFEAKEYVRARRTFNELLFENPLHENAKDAKLKLGLSALETGAARDGYQMLAALAEQAEGEERTQLLDATLRAAEGAGLYGEALRMVVLQAADARTPEERTKAEKRVVDLVEGRAAFLDIARIYQDTPADNPAWPTLAFKLARVYYHLRDFARMQEVLDRFLKVAPQHVYAQRAQEMLARSTNGGPAVKPNVVGVLLPMSGNYKQVGEAVMRGIKLGLAGSDVDVVVKDTKADVMQAGKAVEELVFDTGAIAVMGPLLGDEARRAALVSEELGMPVVTLTRSEDITDIGPHVFRNMLTFSDQARALADYATKELGYKKFAMLYPDIPYGTELTNAFWDELDGRGAEVRGAESYVADQTTFADPVKKLVGRFYLEDRGDYVKDVIEATGKAQGQDAFRRRKALEKVKSKVEPIIDFDAIFMPGDWQTVGLIAPALAVEDVITNACDPKDLERIRKTTGREDLRTVTLLGTDAWKSPTNRTTGLPMLLERGGKFVTCSVYVDGFFAASSRPATRKFVKAFGDAHPDLASQRDPLLLEAIGYDVARMVRQIIEKKKPLDREAFREALSGMKGFDGATGTTSFNDQREAVKPLFYIGIDAKGVQELQPKFLQESTGS
ncbi:MAG: penicillin-binding protein activator [Myxococcaceae bacterium]|nr:penicillin-binding protein activator [Myxococcaceae bacterium]MCI0673243.1 penicillin-binding protein activator [Myxococcaceae bacterium]